MANQTLTITSLESKIFQSPQSTTFKLLNRSTIFDYAVEE